MSSPSEPYGRHTTRKTRRGQWTVSQLRALPATTDVETAGSILGMGLWKSRALIRDGQFPVPVIRHGSRYVVPTRPILALLDVEPADVDGRAAR
ncbi:hypothetical protein BBK14_08015 [Parafrankia soli]|uniref:Helix-turn-helix domain-containing protein n=1 Tax=Parafrankia soli TaxID=2599596 RepID=A0A1S1PKM8_9ACTN|nr:hypothetical protein [Parafrankia soli]OHV21212.1 hypothetical protein BBK14_08015 [Parafrankia soli]